MKRLKIAEVLSQAEVGQVLVVKGWVRAFRSNRFIQLNDGSTINNLQAVVDFEKYDEAILKKITTGAAVGLTGEIVASQGSGQTIELQVNAIEIIGEANPDDVQKTVMQPKKHSLEFLREQAHLRFRTNLFGAVFRVRHAVSFAIHKFFNDKGFFYLHTPIITGSDAEGAGEMFHVTNLDLENLPKTTEGEVDFSEDFFNRPVNLTVSGQLEAELGALALGQVYTFGPTFRAENSNTSRHLAEFWMIEPEVAFNDIHDNMDLAEEMLKYICQYVMENCADDLKFLNEREITEQASKPANERNELTLLSLIHI
jgi:asparaginyl-tRNA synthetase